MTGIYQKITVAATSTALSFAIGAIGVNSAQAVQIIPPEYQIEVIPTGSFELVQASGLAIDTNKNIYIATNLFSGSSELLKITPSGDISSIANFNTFIGGLAINESDQIFGALFDGSIFTIKDSNVSTFASGLPPTLEEIVIDENNNLLVASFTGGTVSKISPEGVVTTFVSGLEGPFGVALKDESLFIGDNLNNGGRPGIIREVTPQGSVTEFFEPIPGRIIDLEYELSSDSFFIANQGIVRNGNILPGTIDIVTDGKLSIWATGFLGGFDAYPREIEFDSMGNLYVADAQKLYKISKKKSTSVPEPATILGLTTILGCGALLKQEHSRKPKKSNL
jgi:DNA-binding beta-propeller fold protein YncE